MLRKLLLLAVTMLCAIIFSERAYADNDHPPAGEDRAENGYVGSDTCALCHANTYTTFKQTWHPNILRPIEAATILGDFSNQDSDLSFGLDEIVWVLGGQYKQRYLTEIDGELYVLPAEWNILTKKWVPYEAENWRDRPYSRYCAGCHTTGYDATNQSWIEPGVGCEACHGPGGDHVASTGSRSEIINPARLAFQDQVEVCAQCHSRGQDPSGHYPFPVGYFPGGPAELSETYMLSTNPDNFWPDGTAKRHHMQYQDWRQGEHRNSVGCIFCHTSHTTGETDHQTRMVGNERCVICHEDNEDLAAHVPFMASSADQINCTDCHMPPISKLVTTDFQILSHTFRAPNPAVSIAYGGQEEMPNSCNLCHEDKNPEWAAQILGQELPQIEATRVSPPTPPAIPTTVVVSGDPVPEGQISDLRQAPPPDRNTWLLGLIFAGLVGVSGAILAIRRMRPA